MSAGVRIECDGGVAEVVLDRAERRNALTPAVMVALREGFEAIAEDQGVGALVIRGSEGFFCSGLDLKEIDFSRPLTDEWVGAHRALDALDVPVIAAVTGGAINAGAALALACDLLVVGESAYVQVKEAQMGMTPPVNAAWLGLRYPAAVGLQLALSCRRFTGPELHRLGIALDVVPDDRVEDHARTLARELAAFPNGGAARTKQMLRAARGEKGRPFAQAVQDALATRARS